MSEHPSSEIQSLVKMANQIADNFSFHDDAVARTVDHIERFWAPSMQKSLVAYVDEGGGGLKPGTLDAVRKLAGG